MAVVVRLGLHNMVVVAVAALLQLEAMEHLVQEVMEALVLNILQAQEFTMLVVVAVVYILQAEQ